MRTCFLKRCPVSGSHRRVISTQPSSHGQLNLHQCRERALTSSLICFWNLTWCQIFRKPPTKEGVSGCWHRTKIICGLCFHIQTEAHCFVLHCCPCVVSLSFQSEAPALFVSLSDQSHSTHTDTSLCCITISGTDSFSLHWWRYGLVCGVLKYVFHLTGAYSSNNFSSSVFRKWTCAQTLSVVLKLQLLQLLCVHLYARIWLPLAPHIRRKNNKNGTHLLQGCIHTKSAAVTAGYEVRGREGRGVVMGWVSFITKLIRI